MAITIRTNNVIGAPNLKICVVFLLFTLEDVLVKYRSCKVCVCVCARVCLCVCGGFGDSFDRANCFLVVISLLGQNTERETFQKVRNQWNISKSVCFYRRGGTVTGAMFLLVGDFVYTVQIFISCSKLPNRWMV